MNRLASLGATTFALVIGIDKYVAKREFGTLKGAVNDANFFYKFLTDPYEEGGLQVPHTHIKFLDNEKATRSAILSTFETHLLKNPDIPEQGDTAMVIFFAGHGSRIEDYGNRMAPDSKIEVICPADERTRGIDGKKVAAIPDYVLAHKLKQLADRKGNNITVILDACHSGGMGRAPKDAENLTVRSPPKGSNIVPPELDANESADRDFSMWSPSSTSHVLLAACGPEGKAYEISSSPIQGYFTQTLVTALRAVHQGTTYLDLIEDLLPLESQIPYCIGDNRDRILFTKHCPVPGRRTFALKEMDVLILECGSDDDIDEGTTFNIVDPEGARSSSTFIAPMVTTDRTILASQASGPRFAFREGSLALSKGVDEEPIRVPLTENSTSKAFLIPIGSFEGVDEEILFPVLTPNGGNTDYSLKAKIVGINQTLLFPQNLSDPIPPGFRVAVTSWKERVSMYIPSDLASKVFPLLGAKRFDRAESQNTAEIILTRVHDTVTITRKVGKTIKYADNACFSLETVGDRGLSTTIGGIAHFHFFLERRNKPESGSMEMKKIQLKMCPLKGDIPRRQPISTRNNDGNIVKESNGLYKVEIPSSKDIRYGFEICNGTNQDLFPYLFYFDPNRYIIKHWYIPPSALDGAPLKANGGKVSVGMGGEGAFWFTLPPGSTKSTCFIKLFVSTRYLDLAWIEQKKSPWEKNFDSEGVSRIYDHRDTFRKPDWGALEVVMKMNEGN
ncbi:caspase domain-containing protein [Mycena epipterygia]|nr:caspase domain-containing protein [Mycena epipterygia]